MNMMFGQAMAASLAVTAGPGLLIDNFAGGGGASTGIEQAVGRPIDIAINHDPEAIAMHVANHPDTLHYCQSVWAVDPLEVVRAGGPDGRYAGQPVALAWFSPDCKHFSKAKGGKPREKHIRDLAWVVVHWVERLKPFNLHPRVIMLENVEEFRTWGPLLEDGKPCPDGKGKEFDRWVRQLRINGYRVEFRELKACDYGAPTSRKRLFMIARCDGLPIVWPKPTHGPDAAEPYRTAADIIDWSIPCPSIFERARPLKEATCRRIATGLMRFVIEAEQPFIVPLTHHGSAERVYNLTSPIPTVTAAHRGEMALVTPYFARTAHGDVDSKGKRRGRGWHGPVENFPTITASQDSALISPVLVGVGGRRAQSAPMPLNRPFPTVTAKADGAIVVPTIIPVTNTNWAGRRAWNADEPLRTVTTAKGGEFGLTTATLIQVGYGEHPGQKPRVPGIEKPLGTVVAGGGKHALVTAILDRQFGKSTGASIATPVPTVMPGGSGKTALISATIVGVGGGEYAGRPRDICRPLNTVTVHNRQALVSAFITKYRANSVGTTMDEPIHTITANSYIKRPGGASVFGVVTAFMAQHNTGVIGHHAEKPVSTISTKGAQQQVVTSNLVKLQNNQTAKPVDQPLDTVLAGGMHHAEVRAFLIKYYGNERDGHGLSSPLGAVTTRDRFGLVTVTIEGIEYAIIDIGMRMLSPRELFKAQGFPSNYIIDPIFNGKPMTKTAQVARCGNAVCPPLPLALVGANLPQLEDLEAAA